MDELDAEAKNSRVAKKSLDFGSFCWSCGAPSRKPPDLEFGGVFEGKKPEKLEDPPPEGFKSWRAYLSWYKNHLEMVSESPLSNFDSDRSTP